jgi:curved DNA-binding protein CbpA
MKNYYETLNLRKDASEEEISNNYKKLVLRWHPKFAK